MLEAHIPLMIPYAQDREVYLQAAAMAEQLNMLDALVESAATSPKLLEQTMDRPAGSADKFNTRYPGCYHTKGKLDKECILRDLRECISDPKHEALQEPEMALRSSGDCADDGTMPPWAAASGADNGATCCADTLVRTTLAREQPYPDGSPNATCKLRPLFYP